MSYLFIIIGTEAAALSNSKGFKIEILWQYGYMLLCDYRKYLSLMSYKYI